jgi:hypothetical protein
MLVEQPAGRTGNTSTSLAVVSPGVTMKLRAMTKSALTTIWFTGGGLLATWLAMAPNQRAARTLDKPVIDRSAAAREVTADDLNAQGARLRQHLNVEGLRQSTRNPFTFGSKPAVSAPTPARGPAATDAPAPPVAPSLALSGIAERNTPQGTVRTAIISSEGQLYLVTEGEPVGARYHVGKVDSDGVVLRDERGTETRLTLR